MDEQPESDSPKYPPIRVGYSVPGALLGLIVISNVYTISMGDRVGIVVWVGGVIVGAMLGAALEWWRRPKSVRDSAVQTIPSREFSNDPTTKAAKRRRKGREGFIRIRAATVRAVFQ